MITPSPSLPDFATAAIILIDFQNAYLDGSRALPRAAAAAAHATHFLAHCREEGATILHIRQHGEPGEDFDLTRRDGAFIPGLAPRAGETVISRKGCCAFFNTNLQTELARRATRSVIFMGFMTHTSICSSARIAHEMGFEAYVIGRACASRALTDMTRPDILMSADLAHAHALAAMNDCSVHVLTQPIEAYCPVPASC